MNEAFRQARVRVRADMLAWGWPARVGLAAGVAAFLALMAQVSVPLPWTPVPFSMQVFGVLVAGTVLGRGHALLSVALYLLAGALGAGVFAGGQSGWRVLVGATGGYLFGFALAAYLVGWYVERRRALLDGRLAWALTAFVALLVSAGLGVVLWVTLRPEVFAATWSGSYGADLPATRYAVWTVAGTVAFAVLAVLLLLARARGMGREKWNLWLVMMAAIGVIHLCGVPVLKMSAGYSWPEALALGSLVFLPFDIVKAGLAVALTAVFLPTSDEEGHFMEAHHA